MTPTWVFPAYPLLLTAPFASTLIQAATQTNQHTVTLNTTAIALCAVATQGAGCLIAFMISAAFIYRLMTQKLPRDFQRPGVVRMTKKSTCHCLSKIQADQELVHFYRTVCVYSGRTR